LFVPLQKNILMKTSEKNKPIEDYNSVNEPFTYTYANNAGAMATDICVDDELRSAITGEELKKRMRVSIRKFFADKQ